MLFLDIYSCGSVKIECRQRLTGHPFHCQMMGERYSMPEDAFDEQTYTWQLDGEKWLLLTELLEEELKWAYYYRRFKLPVPLPPEVLPNGQVQMLHLSPDADETESLIGLLRDLHWPEERLAKLAYKWLGDSN